MTCHSGLPRSGKSGIHSHDWCRIFAIRGYGFRVPRFARPQNDGYDPAASAFSICGFSTESKFSGVIGPTTL
jgi:hypothetical protein